MLKLPLWGEEGHLHIFKHYKTVFIGMSFSLLAITRAVHPWQLKLGFWPVSKTLSGRSKMSQMLCTKCIQEEMAGSFLLLDRTPQPLWNMQCTYTKWVTQLFRPHLLHSYSSLPGERSSIRLKWQTLKYNRRHHPQYAPEVHLSYSLHLCDIYSLYHVLYPSKDSFNYSRGKIDYILHTFNCWKRLYHTKCQISYQD